MPGHGSFLIPEEGSGSVPRGGGQDTAVTCQAVCWEHCLTVPLTPQPSSLLNKVLPVPDPVVALLSPHRDEYGGRGPAPVRLVTIIT